MWRGPGAGFSDIDPRGREKISHAQAAEWSNTSRPILYGHLRGWDYSFVPEKGWLRPAIELPGALFSLDEDSERGGKGDILVGEVCGAVNTPSKDAASNKANLSPGTSTHARIPAASAIKEQQLEGMWMLLRSLGDLPDGLMNSSSVEGSSAYLLGRIQLSNFGFQLQY